MRFRNHYAQKPVQTRRFALLFLLGSSLILTNSPGLMSSSRSAASIQARAKPAATTSRVRVMPAAVFSDELPQTVITIEDREPDPKVKSVVGLYSSNNQPDLRGTFSLFDDGDHGDAVAGDQVWTAQLTFSQAALNLNLFDNSVGSIDFQINIQDKQNQVVNFYLLTLGVVDRAKAVLPRQIAPGMQVSDYAVNVVADSSFFDAGVSNDFPTDMMRTVAASFYEHYPDAFDFLTLLSGGELLGYSFGSSDIIRNETLGLNISIGDDSSKYHSQGRLQHLIYMGQNILATSFIHEVGHHWAAYFNFPKLNLDAPHSDGAHWGTSDVDGQMRNGYNLVVNSDGTVSVQIGPRFDKPYADLELYMMGLLPPQAVTPHLFILNPGLDPARDTVIPLSRTSRVTIDQIVQVYGKRQPDENSSQKSFRTAFILVTPAAASAAELSLIDIIARHHGSGAVASPINFAAATGERASMDTRLIEENFPEILRAEISGKNLVVYGGNFSPGAVILIDGQAQLTKRGTPNPRTALVVKKAGKTLPKNQTVTLQVQNADGTLSPEFTFVRL